MLRPHGGARSGFVHAISTRGQSLAEAPFQISNGASAATVSFELPLELRNQVGRVEIAGERSAGAVSLIDARSQWHRVALISGENLEQAQPLLAPLYYIEKALNPYAELIKPKGSNLAAGIQEALSQNASVLMLADIGTLSGEAAKHVEEWVKKGGVLVRFAGSRLENGGDELLPVPLRVGGRTLGGALVVVDAAEAGADRGYKSLRRNAGTAGGHGQPPGARRSGDAWSRRARVGAPAGRHASGH